MKRRSEKGQALAETAIFSLLAVLLGFAVLALIPVHRTRTAATAAAFACAQFVSQSAEAETAVRQAEDVGRRTIDSHTELVMHKGRALSLPIRRAARAVA